LNVFSELSQEPDNEYAMIDATIVRAHQHSANLVKGCALKKGVLIKPLEDPKAD
jgi:hypothetical protein